LISLKSIEKTPKKKTPPQEDFSRATQSASLGSGAKFPPEAPVVTASGEENLAHYPLQL
jgi:hypothetical protein